MKKLLTISLALFLGAACLLAQDAKIAGKWTMSIETPHGAMQGPLEVKQEGVKISGAYVIEHMGSMAFTGKVEGDKVTMNLEVPGGGGSITMTGKVEGAKMTGTSDKAGAWTATKQ